MILSNGNGTFTCGPYDIMLTLYDVNNKTYHPALFEEYPMPGDIQPKSGFRLKAKFHHTIGATSLDASQILFDEMASKFLLSKENYFRDKILDWDGELGIVIMLPNWK